MPLSMRLAALGLASAAADLGSVLVKAPAWPPGVTAGDWIETAGTYLLLLLYAWVALGISALPAASPRATIPVRMLALLGAAAVTYSFGRGIHLAANSIHDMLDRTGQQDLGGLAYFWDEHAGHYAVDLARIAFAVALIGLERARRRGVRAPSGTAPVPLPGGRTSFSGRAALAIGALAYGFIYFATAVEGQTVWLALPFTIGLAAWGISGARARGGDGGPVRAFFIAAAVVSDVLFAIWGIRHHGFPEFSRGGPG